MVNLTVAIQCTVAVPTAVAKGHAHRIDVGCIERGTGRFCSLHPSLTAGSVLFGVGRRMLRRVGCHAFSARISEADHDGP
jgi:hypothetical protein